MWTSHQGLSAEEPPSAEQFEQWRRRMSPPENEFPAGVGATVLLGRTDDVGVGITQVDAFSTGFSFTLAVRVRQLRPQLAGGGLFMLIGSHMHPGMEVPLEDRLLLGIEYPDGRRASTLNDMRVQGPGTVADAEQVVLVQQGRRWRTGRGPDLLGGAATPRGTSDGRPDLARVRDHRNPHHPRRHPHPGSSLPKPDPVATAVG